MNYFKCPACNAMEKRNEPMTLKCPSCDDETMQEVEPISERDLISRHDDSLDEIYPKCNIAGLEYSTSDALKTVDPVAYRESFNNWLDSETSDGLLVNFDNNYFEVI